MATFNTAGDRLELLVPSKGTVIDIDISGTYDQTILFQIELGSKGSGAWETRFTYDTEDATVAAKYTTERDNENVSLFLSVDGGGSATVTLTDNHNRLVRSFKDLAGNRLLELREEDLRMFIDDTEAFRLDSNGLLVSGGYRRNSDGLVAVTTTPITLTAAAHAGRIISMQKADGIVFTLPAATGSGDVYEFAVATTLTSSGVIQAPDASNIIQGSVTVATDTGGLVIPTAAASDTITMNGTTTGGIIGSWLRLVDAKANTWVVTGTIVSTGNEATPFSAAVP